ASIRPAVLLHGRESPHIRHAIRQCTPWVYPIRLSRCRSSLTYHFAVPFAPECTHLCLVRVERFRAEHAAGNIVPCSEFGRRVATLSRFQRLHVVWSSEPARPQKLE